MVRKKICVTTKSMESCVVELFLVFAEIVIGVWFGLNDNKELNTAFYVAVVLQAMDTAYTCMSFLLENKGKMMRWFRNVLAIMFLLQGIATIVALLCLLSIGINSVFLSYFLCILISLPIFLLIYELVYHMTKV